MCPSATSRFLLLAVIWLFGLVAAASGAQYCVGAPGTACDGGMQPFTAAGLASAISSATAAAGADEVRIASGTLSDVAPITLAGPAAGNVTIAGATGGGTTLRFAAGTTTAIDLTGTAPLGNTLTFLALEGPAAATNAIRVNTPGTLHIFQGLRISGFSVGVNLQTGSGFLLESLVDLGATPSAAGALLFGSGTGALSVQRSTIVGSGSGQSGLYVFSAGVLANATGTATDALIALTGTGAAGLRCTQFSGTASISSARSAYAPAAIVSGCAAPATTLVNVANGAAGFVAPSSGDYRLASYSALIDKGAVFNLRASDLGGNPRYVDGDGDGTTAVDLGAYEYQRRAPNTPVIDLPQTTVAPGAGIRFNATATDPDPGDYTLLSWDFGDGQSSNSSAPTHAYSTLGTYTATVTAEDPKGLTSTAQIQITVANATVDLPTPAPTPTPLDPFATATGPRVRVLTAPTAAVKRTTAGFSTVSAAAPDIAVLESAGAITLRVGLTRLAPGRATRGKCKAGAKKGKKCTARTAISSIGQIPVSPGTVNLRFGGKLGGKRLPKGTYEVTVVPVGIDKKRGLPATYRLTLR